MGGQGNLYVYVGNDPVNGVDPEGLLSWQETYKGLSDFSAGFGDAVTFGLTAAFRDTYGYGGAVNKCSDSYGAGGVLGDIAPTPAIAGKLGNVTRMAQSGGHILNKRTIDELNKIYNKKYDQDRWRRAVESLKKDNNLGNSNHGQIYNGHYYYNGKDLGRIGDYL
jgi:hypothetical protein